MPECGDDDVRLAALEAATGGGCGDRGFPAATNANADGVAASRDYAGGPVGTCLASNTEANIGRGGDAIGTGTNGAATLSDAGDTLDGPAAGDWLNSRSTGSGTDVLAFGADFDCIALLEGSGQPGHGCDRPNLDIAGLLGGGGYDRSAADGVNMVGPSEIADIKAGHRGRHSQMSGGSI